MRLLYKILLGNIAGVIILSMLLFTGTGSVTMNDMLSAFGLTALGVGFIEILVAVIMFIAGQSDWGKGFLLSAGVLILLGFGACSQVTIDFR